LGIGGMLWVSWLHGAMIAGTHHASRIPSRARLSRKVHGFILSYEGVNFQCTHLGKGVYDFFFKKQRWGTFAACPRKTNEKATRFWMAFCS